jgi:hypothetical protein
VGGTVSAVQVAPPSVVATSAAPAGDDAVARVEPTAQHRRAVGQVTARSVCTGAGSGEAVKLPCHGPSVDEGAVVGPTVRVPEESELQAATVPMATRATIGATYRPTARVGVCLADTAHPFPAGSSNTRNIRTGVVTVEDCATVRPPPRR